MCRPPPWLADWLVSAYLLLGRDFSLAGMRGQLSKAEGYVSSANDTAIVQPWLKESCSGKLTTLLRCDEQLEAWILVTTRSVGEQLADSLFRKGEEKGLPVVVMDWQSHETPRLIALCSIGPDIVERWISAAAARLVEELRDFAATHLGLLRRELESWCLGFRSAPKKVT